MHWRTFRWRTWQLAVVCLLALIIGMMIGYASLSSGSTAKQAAPAASTARTTIAASAAGQSAGQSAAPTTAPPVATTTAVPVTGAAATHALLLDLKRETGPLTTSHFTVTSARWTLGWAYDCTAQGGAGSFKVSIRNADGTASTDGGVDQQGAKGSSIAQYTSTGERFLAVDTPCVWAIKVTS